MTHRTSVVTAPQESATTSAVSPEEARQEPGSSRQDESTCPDCEGTIITDEAAGERHCADCGMVVEENRIDHGPDWRNFDHETDNSRVGAPVSEALHDKGLSTQISWQDRDANGNRISSRKRRRMSRLRKWDERFRTQDVRDRNNKKGFTEIQRMTSALGLPTNIAETSAVIFRQASEQKVLLGRSIEAVATGATYLAAQLEGIPRTFDEFAHVSRVERVAIRRAQSAIDKKLKLPIKPTTPEVYIPRFANKLDASERVVTEAKRLTSHLSETNHISGRKPSALAAVALYAASITLGTQMTQNTVDESGLASEVTVRNTYKLFLDADPTCEYTLDELESMNSAEIKSELSPEPTDK
jgi:transcription initiation factor TFIIB